MRASFDLFAACQPGLEPLLAGELRALGIAPVAQRGGVAFHGGVADAMRCGLWLGTASHLLLRVAQFRCRALGELERKAAELPWRSWLRAHVALAVDATTRGSRIYHTGAAEERVRDAIARALGKTPPAAAAGDEIVARVHVRFRDDVCTVSLDATSTPLHRRGYRLDARKAPLREDLAHALVLASGWTPGTPLLDPFCGSGTIAIEAAGLALGLAPGRLRPPPLEQLALFDGDAWQAIARTRTALPASAGAGASASAGASSGAVAATDAPAKSSAAATPPAPGSILGSDRDAGAIDAANANAARAGVAAVTTFTVAAITASPWLQPGAAPAGGALVTNPPFGLRVGKGGDLLPLYQTLGHRAATLGPDWRVALLAHDLRLARRTGLPLRAAFTTKHGGLTVAALVGTATPTPPPTTPDPVA